jgi:hypothetical protein
MMLALLHRVLRATMRCVADNRRVAFRKMSFYIYTYSLRNTLYVLQIQSLGATDGVKRSVFNSLIHYWWTSPIFLRMYWCCVRIYLSGCGNGSANGCATGGGVVVADNGVKVLLERGLDRHGHHVVGGLVNGVTSLEVLVVASSADAAGKGKVVGKGNCLAALDLVDQGLDEGLAHLLDSLGLQLLNHLGTQRALDGRYEAGGDSGHDALLRAIGIVTDRSGSSLGLTLRARGLLRRSGSCGGGRGGGGSRGGGSRGGGSSLLGHFCLCVRACMNIVSSLALCRFRFGP